MTSVKLNTRPFEGSLNNFIDSLFTDFPVFANVAKSENLKSAKGFVPVNVKETEQSFKLEVIAPGFEKSDFAINVEDNQLTIAAEKKPVEGNEKTKEIRKEYSISSFKRFFTLNDLVDATKISASYINGVLELNLPKKQEVKPAVTEIKIN